MKTQAIETVVGILYGRNAIYLDEVHQRFDPPTPLFFKGALSTSCCQEYKGTSKFIDYSLLFENTKFFSCCELDYYKHEKSLSSSFDTVQDSNLLQMFSFGSEYKHYVLATYDLVYEIVAKKFTLSVHEKDGSIIF